MVTGYEAGTHRAIGQIAADTKRIADALELLTESMATLASAMKDGDNDDNDDNGCEHEVVRWELTERHGQTIEWTTGHAYCNDCDVRLPNRDGDFDGAPTYRPGMGPGDPVRCDND